VHDADRIGRHGHSGLHPQAELVRCRAPGRGPPSTVLAAESDPKFQGAQWPLKIIAAICTDGTFSIVIRLTPSPRSAHQRSSLEGGGENAKDG
jgi:hypothetical protein